MGKTAQLKIESAIGNKDPWLELWGITDNTFSASDMSKFLSDNQDADTVEIEIRSDGGNVDVAFDCYDQLQAWVKEKQGRKIVTKGYRVNSSATILFLSAEIENRYISDNVQFVIHNPYICDLWGTYTADELAKLEEYVRGAEDKIFNFYVDRCSVPTEKQQELKDLMNKDTDLGKDKALSFGFASNTITGGTKSTEDKNTKKVAFAYTNEMSTLVMSNLKNQSSMDKVQIGLLAKIGQGIEALLKGKSVKAEETVKDETGVLKDGTKFYYEGSLAVDTPVYSDEAMTAAMDDGNYTLEDERTMVVAEGKVSEISEPVDAKEDDEKKKEEEKAQNELKDLKAKLANAEAENKTLKEGLQNLKTDFETFKKDVPGANDPNTQTGKTEVTNTVTNSIQAKMLQIRKEKNQ